MQEVSFLHNGKDKKHSNATRIGQKMWKGTGKEMGCDGNHEYFHGSNFIIDNTNLLQYIFTAVIVWNIANFIDDVTYTN